MSPEEQSEGRVIDLLDALESVVVAGRRVVFTPNVMVNEDEALDLIDRTRQALPEDVKQARHVLDQQRELVAAADDAARRLLDQARVDAESALAAAHAEAERVAALAHAEADRVVQEARAAAAQLVADHAVTRAAGEHAAAAEAEAARRADRFRIDSEDYARELLAGLEQQVARAQASLRKALDALPPH